MRIGVNCFLLQAHIGGLKQYFVNLFEWLLENDRGNTYVFFHFPHNASELAKLKSTRWKEAAILLQDQSEILKYLNQLDVYFCPFQCFVAPSRARSERNDSGGYPGGPLSAVFLLQTYLPGRITTQPPPGPRTAWSRFRIIPKPVWSSIIEFRQRK